MIRSRSESSACDEAKIRRYPKTFLEVMAKKTGRIYRTNSGIDRYKVRFDAGESDRLACVHREKRFEGRIRFSPLRKTEVSLNRTGQTERTNDLCIKEKSKEVLSHAHRVMVKEKENTEGVMRADKGYQSSVRDKLKGINRNLIANGIPTIELTRKIVDIRKVRQKILINIKY